MSSQPEIWKNLNVPDIILLCQSDKTLMSICQDKRTWEYLLSRDFNIIRSSKDPRKLYFKNVLNKLSEMYLREADDYYNTHKYFEDAALLYTIALSALGKDITGTVNLFGNQIGNKLIRILKNFETGFGPTMLHGLFYKAGMLY